MKGHRLAKCPHCRGSGRDEQGFSHPLQVAILRCQGPSTALAKRLGVSYRNLVRIFRDPTAKRTRSTDAILEVGLGIDLGVERPMRCMQCRAAIPLHRKTRFCAVCRARMRASHAKQPRHQEQSCRS